MLHTTLTVRYTGLHHTTLTVRYTGLHHILSVFVFCLSFAYLADIPPEVVAEIMQQLRRYVSNIISEQETCAVAVAIAADTLFG